MKIIHVVGARPNFMKLAPVYLALRRKKVKQIIVHTGQHYSANMSNVFFKELEIPDADVNLGVGSGSQAEQVAKIMIAFEKIVAPDKPNIVIVYGDVNSTLAASIVCAKLQIKVVHVEAGLRSFDSTMPEEINRIITDRLSDMFFTPSMDANLNLKKEGAEKSKIYFVGNVMIDTLVRFLNRQSSLEISTPQKYAVVTLHRPSNVDDNKKLKLIIKNISDISNSIPIFFPVHPRTKIQLESILKQNKANYNIKLLPPLGYIDFLNLIKKSTMVITDSGGIQEETTFLGIPCLTLRENTERPVTVDLGTNTLIGNDFDLLKKNVINILKDNYKIGRIPDLWDGHTAERIANILIENYA